MKSNLMASDRTDVPTARNTSLHQLEVPFHRVRHRGVIRPRRMLPLDSGSRTRIVYISRACFSIFLAAVLGGILMAGSALASGTIAGAVTDSLTSEPLVGASVQVLGTSLGAATDLDGRYRIDRIPAGTYTLRASFLGFEPREIAVTVTDDATVRVDFALIPAVLEGEQIVVSAQLEGQRAAINQQLTSNTILNVVSEEKIQELPDANAAEALGRLPGVSVQRSGGEANKIVLRGLSDRFSSFTINGVRIAPTDADARGVDLSTIAQGSLAGIELFKALTPDKDADAIAGSVNFITKKAPSQRLLRLDARGSYNQLNSNFGQYDVGLRYGQRFFDDMLGVQLTGNLEQRDRSKESVDIDYDLRGISDGNDFRISDFTVNFTDEVRSRSGAGLVVDFNLPDGGSVRLNNIYNRTKREFTEYDRNYPVDGDLLTYGARDREQAIDTYSGSLIAEHSIMGMRANWGVSLAHSRSDFPFDYDVRFTEPSTLGPNGEPVSHMKPIPRGSQKGPLEELIPFALNNFERSFFYTAFFRDEESGDTEKTAFLDLSRDYAFSRTFSGRLKAGGKYRHRHRDRNRGELVSPYYLESYSQYERADDGSIREKDLSGTRFQDLDLNGTTILLTNFLSPAPDRRSVFDRFDLFPLLDRDAVREWWQINQDGFTDQNGNNPEYERNLEADAAFYDVVERVAAGYVMNTFNAGDRLTLITGVRVEREDNDYASRYSPDELSGFPVPSGAIRDTFATHQEAVWLPNAHLTLRPWEFLNLRLAAYRALARPNFNHRLNSFLARKSGTFYSGNVLVIGNPELRAAQAWNYEANASIYGNKIGLFSISVFRKDIKDMFHIMDGIPFLSTNEGILEELGIRWENPFKGANFVVTFPYNSTRPTRVWGVELEHQTNFWYLPGLLRHIVLSYNLSLVRSSSYVRQTRVENYTEYSPILRRDVERARIVMFENEQKLEGQPEVFGNVALGYDTGRFSARASVFHQGEFNDTFSSDRRSDTVVNDFTRLDLAFRYNFSDHVSVIFNVNNITDVEEGRTILNRVTGWHLLDANELYGRTADLGVRLTW